VTYWVQFNDGTAGCIELVNGERPASPPSTGASMIELREIWKAYFTACTDAVKKKAAEVKPGVETTVISSLPYPADPRLGTTSTCPPFCYSPSVCAGRSSCPKSYACSE
jgi:hypothetical protein